MGSALSIKWATLVCALLLLPSCTWCSRGAPAILPSCTAGASPDRHSYAGWRPGSSLKQGHLTSRRLASRREGAPLKVLAYGNDHTKLVTQMESIGWSQNALNLFNYRQVLAHSSSAAEPLTWLSGLQHSWHARQRL